MSEWSVGARSETGYAREENQDRMARARTELGDVYIISDGVGGSKAGALAAEITVEVLQKSLADVRNATELEKAIRSAFEAANTEVYRRAHNGDAQTQGMGATAVVLMALQASAIVAHVGDSRAYLLREGRLRQLTKDHTRVQRMVDAHMITEQQGKDHSDAGLLERAIGHELTVDVDVSEAIPLNHGDELLLCSDGLCSYVDHAQIEAVLRKPISPAEQVNELIALALMSGGHDNVTVQVIRYEGGMNERRRQVIVYQLAFLPLVVLVAAATSYGVDHMNRPRPDDASPARAGASNIAAPLRLDPSIETLKRSVEGLVQQTADLKTRISTLENRVAQSSSAPLVVAPTVSAPVTPPKASRSTAGMSAKSRAPDTATRTGKDAPGDARPAPTEAKPATERDVLASPVTPVPVAEPSAHESSPTNRQARSTPPPSPLGDEP